DWLAVPFAGITPAPSQERGQDLFPTGNWRAIRPVYRDKMPPCNNACGTNEKIQGYLDLVKRGKYLDAYALIKEDMPFPSVTGRVCYHPCEQACNRGKYDEAISIRAVERFLGDLGQALTRDVVNAGAPNGKEVTWDDLKKHYDACVLAVGLTEPNSVRADGEQKDGVLYGLPFLRDIGMGTSQVTLGPRVAVIGGGNTAIDCAREALRQGAV